MKARAVWRNDSCSSSSSGRRGPVMQIHSFICRTKARRVTVGRDGHDLQVGDAGLLERRDALLDVGLRADEVAHLQQLQRYDGLGVALVAAEVHLLDLRGLLLEAVLAGQRVVEVLALGAHAADVERRHRAGEVEHALHVVADADHAAGHHLERLRDRPAASPCRRPSASPQTSFAFSGANMNGSQPSAYSAVPCDVLLAERGDVDRHRRPLGLRQHLQRLAEAEALTLRERQREDLPVVVEPLAAQRHAHDVDDLAGASQRLVVGHARASPR